MTSPLRRRLFATAVTVKKLLKAVAMNVEYFFVNIVPSFINDLGQ
jgi:hypothetical protein